MQLSNRDSRVLLGRGLACSLAMVMSCGGGTPPPTAEPAPDKPTSPGAPTSSSGCAASASWFANPSFPGEVPNGGNSNCDFHQFAWQAFVDLVQPVNGSPGLRTFETYMPEYGIFTPPGTPVTPWGQQPSVPCSLAAADAQHAKRVFLRPRVAKGAGFDPNSDLQASGQPLYDQLKQVVYYSMWVNQTEYDFITSCSFNNTSCVTSAPRTTALPPRSVELKGSWRVFPGAIPLDMYTIRGVINPVLPDGSLSKRCVPVTLGLVGFHLVVNTPQHKEFIWATFEHKSNAPDCVQPQSPPLGGWSFNNPNCPTSNPACQINVANAPPTPTQVCRAVSGGGGSADNVAAIAAINQSVHQTLAQLLQSSPDQYGPMAIWQNYDLTANLWTDNGQPPPQGREAGSVVAANTTMETYVQGAPTSGDGHKNCFFCHNVTQFRPKTGPMGFPEGAPANLSHLWGFAQQTGGCGGGKGPLPPACPIQK